MILEVDTRKPDQRMIQRSMAMDLDLDLETTKL